MKPPFELPEADFEVQQHFAPCTIGFLKIRNQGKIIEPEAAGSGTLVRLHGDVFGVLTAAHVLQEFPEQTDIGIMLVTRPKRPRQIKIRFETEDLFFPPSWATTGMPDIAFARIHEPKRSDLMAYGCVFYDLERQREGIKQAAKSHRFESYLVGVIADTRRQHLNEPHGSPITEYTFGFIHCDQGTPVEQGGFTLTSQTPRFGSGVPPESYGGMSGGGWWILTPIGKAVERSLMGVMFWQTDRVDGHRTIRCHHLLDVYEHLLAYVLTKIFPSGE